MIGRSLGTGVLSRLAVVSLFALTACGVPTFSPHYADNQRDALRDALSRIQRHSPKVINQTGSPLLFIVGSKPDRVMSYDVKARRTVWAFNDKAASRIYVGPSALAYVSEGELRGRAISDGRLLWQSKLAAGRLIGAAVENDALYVVTTAPDGALPPKEPRARLTAYDMRDGEQRWQRPSSGRLGVPAARDGLVILPLRQQSLSVVDGRSGAEIARIRSGEETLTWVRSLPDGVYYGNTKRVYRLTEQSASETVSAATTGTINLPQELKFPFWHDGYDPALAAHTAQDRRRLLWSPVAARGVPLLGRSTAVAHYYRYLFAFRVGEDGSATLKWGHHHAQDDYVASNYQGNVVSLVTSEGDVDFIDVLTGAGLDTVAIDTKVIGATFDIGEYRPDVKPGEPHPVGQILAETIWDPDNRFKPIKLFAVEALSKLSGAEVSRRLVQILTRKDVDQQIYRRLADMLVARNDRAAIPIYIEALKVHYDYVEQTEARGVEVMARALGALQATEAVPSLLSHFADHETTPATATAIVEALAMIGSSTIIDPFRDFLLTYRCSSAFKYHPMLMQKVVDVLIGMGGEKEARILAFTAQDLHTDPPLRDYIERAISRSAEKRIEDDAL